MPDRRPDPTPHKRDPRTPPTPGEQFFLAVADALGIPRFVRWLNDWIVSHEDTRLVRFLNWLPPRR